MPATLAKLCSNDKQHFAYMVGQSPRMVATPPKSINQVLADNLAHWMKERKFESQQALANKCGLSQRTISNYLNPSLRTGTSKGKEPSAKLAELGALAAALNIEVWQLLRDLSPADQKFYERLEAAYRLADSRTNAPNEPPHLPSVRRKVG